MVNSTYRKTLRAIFETPPRANPPFPDIEQLLLALGAELTEGAGSRIELVLQHASWHGEQWASALPRSTLASFLPQLVSKGLAHDIRKRLPFNELAQSVIHQRLIVAAHHLGARLERR